MEHPEAYPTEQCIDKHGIDDLKTVTHQHTRLIKNPIGKDARQEYYQTV
jgi:hypothetical protein